MRPILPPIQELLILQGRSGENAGDAENGVRPWKTLTKLTVHLDGLEPSTFGSVDRLETIENRNILRGFDAFLNLTPLQIVAMLSRNCKAFLYYRLRFSVVVFSVCHRLTRPTACGLHHLKTIPVHGSGEVESLALPR